MRAYQPIFGGLPFKRWSINLITVPESSLVLELIEELFVSWWPYFRSADHHEGLSILPMNPSCLWGSMQ